MEGGAELSLEGAGRAWPQQFQKHVGNCSETTGEPLQALVVGQSVDSTEI